MRIRIQFYVHSSVLMQVIIIVVVLIALITLATFSIARLDSIQQLAQPLAGGSCVPGQDRAQQGTNRVHGCVAALIVALRAIFLLFFVVVDAESLVDDIRGQRIDHLVVICQTIQVKN